jgi:predicted metal-dependent hydrolase
MQMTLPFGSQPKAAGPDPPRDLIVIGRQAWPVTYIRHRRARHYVLRLEDDGSVRVTIPRGGSRKDAERFAKHKGPWIERERYRRAVVQGTVGWRDGSRLLLRGTEVTICVDRDAGVVRVGDEEIGLPLDGPIDVRRLVTGRLRRLAERELPGRLTELAAASGLLVTRVTVRDQRSRWGSCAPSGRISLNWRLIQVPASVRDYVLLHELTHLHEPNHSTRFWEKLGAVCPWHREAREWLRTRFSGSMSDPWSPNPAADTPRPTEPARPS